MEGAPNRLHAGQKLHHAVIRLHEQRLEKLRDEITYR
jgi:hypothetical protein